MAKKLSSWNKFVKQVFEEGKKSNPSYSFKDALKEASSRKKKGHYKSEDSSHSDEHKEESHKKTKKRRSRKSRKSRKTRKHRKSRKH